MHVYVGFLLSPFSSKASVPCSGRKLQPENHLLLSSEVVVGLFTHLVETEHTNTCVKNNQSGKWMDGWMDGQRWLSIVVLDLLLLITSSV